MYTKQCVHTESVHQTVCTEAQHMVAITARSIKVTLNDPFHPYWLQTASHKPNSQMKWCPIIITRKPQSWNDSAGFLLRKDIPEILSVLFNIFSCWLWNSFLSKRVIELIHSETGFLNKAWAYWHYMVSYAMLFLEGPHSTPRMAGSYLKDT